MQQEYFYVTIGHEARACGCNKQETRGDRPQTTGVPVPGGPTRSTPLGSFPPRVVNL